MATKFLGAITVPAAGWAFSITVSGGATAGSVPPGTYYISGDGTASDFVKAFNDAAQTAMTTESPGVTITTAISAAGIVSIVISAATATLTWTSTDLRDVLRFVGTSTALSTSPASGHRAARYFAYSSYPVQSDVPTTTYRSSTDEADDGTTRTLVLSPQIARYRIGVRYQGPHRPTVFNDYSMWQAFYEDVISTGVLMRWYPDTSITAAFSDTYDSGTPTTLDTPYGYHVGRIVEPTEWTPVEMVAGWYGYYTAALVLQVQAS